MEFKNFNTRLETIVVPNQKQSSNSSQVAHCAEFDLISYLSLWILHNIHINRLLEGTRPFRTWLVYSAYSLGLSFLILWLLFEHSISNSLGIPQCSLVKCGCWSFLLAIQNVSTQSLESIPMYFMLSKFVTLDKQRAIFLYCSVTGLTVRHLGEQFQRSNETITL